MIQLGGMVQTALITPKNLYPPVAAFIEENKEPADFGNRIVGSIDLANIRLKRSALYPRRW